VSQKYRGKLLFDTSERREWEQALVSEFADAVSLPTKNFAIEEVGNHAA
jgi:hypothetical protein